jgi:hypothetical protein
MEPDAPRGTLVRTTLIANTLPLSALEWQSKSGGVARSLVRERAVAPAGQSLGVSVEPVPLVAVEGDTLAPATSIVLGGQAAVSATVAAQVAAAAGPGIAVIEVFELA